MSEDLTTSSLNNSTTVLPIVDSNSTNIDINNVTTTISTITSTILSTASTILLNTTTSTIDTTTASVETTANTVTEMLTTTTVAPDATSGLLSFSFIFFIVAIALIAKIIISNRKNRADIIGGSARWRIAASQQSGAFPSRTAAAYAPMDNRRPGPQGGLDAPGPDQNLDWERQFFDDSEPVEPSRLRLDFGHNRT